MKRPTRCWCGAAIVVSRESAHTYTTQRDFPRHPEGTVDVAAIPMRDVPICERGHWQPEPEPVAQLALFDEDETRTSIHDLNETVLDRWKKER